VPTLQTKIVAFLATAKTTEARVSAAPWWKSMPGHLVDWQGDLTQAEGEDQSAQPTPLKPKAWARLLEGCPYVEEVKVVLQIINTGANIQFVGDRTKRVAVENLRSASSYPQAIEDYLVEEVLAGRVEGPFARRPDDLVRIVPMGSVPKDEHKRRVILNYSAPEGASVNEEIEKLECQLDHFDRVMAMMGELPPDTMMIKIDVKSAFRLVPVVKEDRALLGMEWKGVFYRDNCLPFGLSSSPPLWERISRALEWVIRRFVTPHAAHYVDDFLLAVPAGWDAKRVLDRALAVFEILGVPISKHKLVGPTTRLEFLGVTVDSTRRLCEVSKAKQTKLVVQLRAFVKQRQVPFKRLESVVGLLQFVTNVVRPGKAFIARLRDSLKEAEGPMVTLGRVGKADALWWLHYLPSWPGTSYLRPAAELRSNTTTLVTDACKDGMGAVFGKRWIAMRWSEQWIKQGTREKAISMPFMELAAVVVAVNTWATEVARMTVVVYCDCLPVVEAASKGYSPKTGVMGLLRELAGLAMTHHLRLRFVHIPTDVNHVADLLSRDQLQTAQETYPWLAATQDQINEHTTSS
jgi:hypothetical protein